MAESKIKATRPKVDRKARFTIPPQPIPKQDPFDRLCNWNEVVIGFDANSARIEAERCIQCPAAPCITACPVHNDIPGALWLLEQGDILGAADKFRETSSMPEICGRICPQERLCEGSCVVGKKKDPNNRPVAIGRLEAFVADTQRRTLGKMPAPEIAAATGKSVAVVGAGPAGITAAERLRTKGHAVTMFDFWPKPGGILLYGIPNFKLGKEIVDQKLEMLEQIGVTFRHSVNVGRDLSVDDLLAQGYDAVLLAQGAPIGASPRLAGEDLPGVYQATDFLVRGNLPAEARPASQQQALHLEGKRVVVIGGGDTAMDCVRTAVRSGAASVTCVYRRTEAEMPGREEERKYAKEEGVQFYFLAQPVRVVQGEDGHVAGIECVRSELGEPDGSGRRRPVTVAGSEFTLDADTVVLATGYWADPVIAETTPGLEANKDGEITVEPETGQTSRAGVFAGGDSVRGADLVVTAVADGKAVARAIHEYLTGEVWEANELID